MALFSKKVHSYLGVDVGSSSIKIVELEDDAGEPVLKNYAFAEKPYSLTQSRGEAAVPQLADIIKQVYDSAEFTSREVIAALHNFDVFTSVINLPKTSPQELDNVIKVEARKFVPIPLEDVILDWKVLDKLRESKEEKQKVRKFEKKQRAAFQPEGVDILLTAAPRSLVTRYLRIFEKARLHLLSLETESFALIRSLLPESEMSSLMIIDIGLVATDIIIVEQQIPVVIRTVDAGGAVVTAAIERSLGISKERAEQFKRDIGILADQQARQNNTIVQIIESTFSPIFNEVNYSIDLYKTRNKSIEKIILSGGSAYLLGLVDFLKSTFDLPVHIGDPWHKVNYPAPLQASLKELAPMFAVTVGLALKEVVE